MEYLTCGVNVGAAFPPEPPDRAARVSRAVSSHADNSFLPAWRLISTTNVSPRPRSTAARMARAGSAWYGRSRVSATTSLHRLHPPRHPHRVLEHEHLPHHQPRLQLQVADLAERRQVPTRE